MNVSISGKSELARGRYGVTFGEMVSLSTALLKEIAERSGAGRAKYIQEAKDSVSKAAMETIKDASSDNAESVFCLVGASCDMLVTALEAIGMMEFKAEMEGM